VLAAERAVWGSDDPDLAGETPRELELAWLVERWGAAAVFGPQGADYGLLQRMSLAQNVYNTIRAVRRAKGEALLRLPPETHRLFEWLVEEGFADL